MGQTETKSRQGRKPSRINCVKPGVGMSYVALTKDTAGNKIHVRVGTTCARDTNESKKGELIGVQLANYSGIPGAGLGEKYFTGKLARKGSFIYLIFLCSVHHGKTMGFEVKPEELLKENIGTTVSNLLANAKDHGAAVDGANRVCINGYIKDVAEYEWLSLSRAEAINNGIELFHTNKNGAFEQKENKKSTPVQPDVVETPVQPDVVETPVQPDVVETPVQPDVVETPVQPDVVEVAKESGAVKARKTYYGIKDGKIIKKRTVNVPAGFYKSKEAAEAQLAV